jgi:hypothetical protein
LILHRSVLLQAAPSAAWEVLLPAAGHFQYLDSTTALQRAVCGGGADGPDDAAVRAVSQAALVAWGEAMVKRPGADVISSLAARCSSFGLPSRLQAEGGSSGGGGASASAGGSVYGLSRSSTSGGGDQSVGQLDDFSKWLQQQLQQQTSQQPQGHQQQHAASAQPLDSAAALVDSIQQHSQAGISQQEQGQPAADLSESGQQKADQAQDSVEQPEQQQQQQQQLAALPRVQTRQELWLAGRAPAPARLQALQADLERLMVAVSYQSAAAVEVRNRFKNFG